MVKYILITVLTLNVLQGVSQDTSRDSLFTKGKQLIADGKFREARRCFELYKAEHGMKLAPEKLREVDSLTVVCSKAIGDPDPGKTLVIPRVDVEKHPRTLKAPKSKSIEKRLASLQKLHRRKLITDEEYKQTKAKLLDREFLEADVIE